MESVLLNSHLDWYLTYLYMSVDFICRHTDPQYIKTKKLEILTTIASESNVEEVVTELRLVRCGLFVSFQTFLCCCFLCKFFLYCVDGFNCFILRAYVFILVPICSFKYVHLIEIMSLASGQFSIDC